MKITEIRALSDAELVSKKRDCKQETFNLRLQQQNAKIEKPSRINLLRKTAAKIETVMSERRLGIAVKSKSVGKKK